MSLTDAFGDIHGCLDKLRSLLLRCEMHAGGRPLAFVFVGGDINRGTQSSAVIDCLIDLKVRHGESVVTLLENHEATALAAIDGTSTPAAGPLTAAVFDDALTEPIGFLQAAAYLRHSVARLLRLVGRAIFAVRRQALCRTGARAILALRFALREFHRT
jgi:hypothetical protein